MNFLHLLHLSILGEYFITRYLAERNEARKQKNFKRADDIREFLLALGFIIKDTKEGTEVYLLKRIDKGHKLIFDYEYLYGDEDAKILTVTDKNEIKDEHLVEEINETGYKVFYKKYSGVS